ncbi:Uma2 family endonuclease [Spirosoma pollinicola]|uniref:Uma2 family endonuclease n=1 Tax=Spirosoma pollinicola TaxID=2057025 RepID=A0A2K8YYM4_9BACT|nr:Uma2 family endonuclease [Spirosoma pollinicola]AUD02731.1 Uma2 family endonuclease [Spirosoma pollinicola]
MEAIVDQPALTDYEIERGKPMLSFNHGLLEARIIFEVMDHYRDTFDIVSEVTLQSPNPSTVPDLSIFPSQPSNWTKDEIKVARVPFTVVEILSPSQSVTELIDKSLTYFSAGVKSYWLVQPMLRVIFVLLPGDEELVFHNEVLTDPTTGISIDLKKVFR